jgi:hypothetical protein
VQVSKPRIGRNFRTVRLAVRTGLGRLAVGAGKGDAFADAFGDALGDAVGDAFADA